MADQLVLTINRAADSYRWCWLDARHVPLTDTAASGDAEALATALQGNSHQAWLIVPGTKVVTRTLEYSEKEKKHLRNLLPFQLEETVIGDVDKFHFALGPLEQGTASLAYIEKAWLEQVFAQLAALNIEITQCWPAPLTLPLERAALADTVADDTLPNEQPDYWTLALQDGVVMVRYEACLGFSIDQPHTAVALQLLLTAQKRVDQLPLLTLCGANDADLQTLYDSLPSELQGQVASREHMDFWQRDYSSSGINLCQGSFSQRLPIERWWLSWRAVASLAAACFAVHIGILLYQIHDFGNENLEIRQQIEATYRRVVPQGALVDAERQLSGMVRELQPASQTGSVTNLLAKVLPPLGENTSVNLRSIQFIGETGELNLQLQSSEYDAIEALRGAIEANGLRAELLGSSAQGNTHSARLKISQLNP